MKAPDLDDPALSDRLDQALRQPGPPWDSLALLTVLRHVPARRAALLGVVDQAPVVVKVFASPRARGNHRRLLALTGVGLGDMLPGSLATDSSGHVEVLDYRPGEILDAVGDATFLVACTAAGRALTRLHAAAVPLDRAWRHSDEIAQLLRRAPASTRGIAESAAALPVEVEPHLVCAHRDFHPRQVVVDEAAQAPVRVGFIDLDDAALAPAGLDVGNMVAHLRREAITGRRSTGVAQAAIEAFLNGYGPPPPDLETWETLALARLAGLAETRHHRPDERDSLLNLLGELTSATPTRPDSTITISTGHHDRPVSVVTGADGERVVLKRYLSADGDSIHEAMSDLWQSSFGAGRTEGAGLPQPLGFDAPRGELAMSFAPGEPLGARGDLGLTLRRDREAAHLLADLHGSGVVVSRVRTRDRLLRSAGRKAAELVDTPTGAAFAAALFAVNCAWEEPPERPEQLVVCHGDFSPRNVLNGPQGLVLIDFDRLQMSHPLRDVAYWSAWIWTTVTTRDPSMAADAWRLSDGFLAAYAERSGLDLRPLGPELSIHRALGLIRIAHGWSSLRADPIAQERVLAMATQLAQRPAVRPGHVDRHRVTPRSDP